jgi:NADPH:quinone reductase-like Zn-dependent oxidoreductase
MFPRGGAPDVLRLMEVQRAVPKDDEFLVRVHAASLNAFTLYVNGCEPSPVQPHPVPTPEAA